MLCGQRAARWRVMMKALHKEVSVQQDQVRKQLRLLWPGKGGHLLLLASERDAFGNVVPTGAEIETLILNKVLARDWRAWLEGQDVQGGGHHKLFRLLQHRLAFHRLTSTRDRGLVPQKSARFVVHEDATSPSAWLLGASSDGVELSILAEPLVSASVKCAMVSRNSVWARSLRTASELINSSVLHRDSGKVGEVVAQLLLLLAADETSPPTTTLHNLLDQGRAFLSVFHHSFVSSKM